MSESLTPRQLAKAQNVERIKAYLGKITVDESVSESKSSGAKGYAKEIMPLEKRKPSVGCISRGEVASYE